MNAIQTILNTRAAILDDLYRRFHDDDKTVKCLDPKNASYWFRPLEQRNCFTGAGEMTCPVCKTGKLRYSRSAINCHVCASCSTPDCVRWME